MELIFNVRRQTLTYTKQSPVVAAIAGVKEATDSKWDNKDFMATMAGCLFLEIKF